MAETRLAHIRALDGLRGLAVLAVVLFHAQHLTGGYLGVDLFFVLSGFLITTLLLREHAASGRIQLGNFWSRRARRLLPALGLMLLGVALVAALVSSTTVDGLRGDAWATILYVANWRAIFTGNDYWALFRSPSPLEHTWSLAIEEQFYLVWPLVVVGIAAIRRTSLARTVLVLSVVSAALSYLALQLLYDPTDSARAYYGTDTRASSILIGAALAAALVAFPGELRPRQRALLSAAGWVGAGLLAVAWSRLPGDDPMLYRIGFLACAVASAAVIATTVRVPDHRLNSILAWRPFRGLGLISYGIYLWHWPVDVYVDSERTGLRGWPLFALQCSITLTVALASYYLVEQPIRRGWGTTRIWRVATPALVAGLAIVLVVSTAASGSTETALVGPATIAAPTNDSFQLEQLRLSQLAGPNTPRVILGGDSIGFTLANYSPTTPGVPFVAAGAAMIGCGITDGTAIGLRFTPRAKFCQQWVSTVRRAIPIFKPRALVMLSGAWDIWPRKVNGKTLPMYSRALEAETMRALSRAHRIATDAHIPLILLTVPCLHPNAVTLALAPGLDDPRRVTWINSVFRRFAKTNPQTHLIDLHSWACRQPKSAFVDGVHFSADGGRAAWRWLFPQIEPLLAPAP